MSATYTSLVLGEPDAYIPLEHTVLGQVFMRGVYIVMDQDNSEVYLANAVNCGSELVAIDKDVSAISSLTGKCQAPRRGTESFAVEKAWHRC